MITATTLAANNNNTMTYIDGERSGPGVVPRACGVSSHLILTTANDCHVPSPHEVTEAQGVKKLAP